MKKKILHENIKKIRVLEELPEGNTLFLCASRRKKNCFVRVLLPNGDIVILKNIDVSPLSPSVIPINVKMVIETNVRNMLITY